ncbi:MAG TPA: hypothetical protein VK699_10790 [Terriglobales bacterium]|jgi:hypothetical protein|nr:hypothetical protein [Terriglobales bacterium]
MKYSNLNVGELSGAADVHAPNRNLATEFNGKSAAIRMDAVRRCAR